MWSFLPKLPNLIAPKQPEEFVPALHPEMQNLADALNELK